MTTDQALVRLEQVKRYARLMDASIPVPGTKLTFGIDAVIGLVPGFGDAVGMGFSTYIIWQAFRVGASKRLLTRMLYNVSVDGILGAIPLLGDWHDLVWKANIKNAQLLERQVLAPEKTARASGWFLLAIVGTLMAIGIAAMVLAVWTFRRLIGLIG
jgi:hypothetical protein